jgi:hypothetical protein
VAGSQPRGNGVSGWSALSMPGAVGLVDPLPPQRVHGRRRAGVPAVQVGGLVHVSRCVSLVLPLRSGPPVAGSRSSG